MPNKQLRTEDYLPKVLVTGKPGDAVPPIIICDGGQKRSSKSNRHGKSTKNDSFCPGPSPPCAPPPCAPSPCAPPPCPPKWTPPRISLERPEPPPPVRIPKYVSKKFESNCCPPPPAPRQPSNYDESSACTKLMLRMQSLKEEMNEMTKQNQRMQQQIKTGSAVQKCRQKRNDSCARPATFPKDVEERFRDYSKHTCLLEKQVDTMEQSVKKLQEQFVEVEKKKREMDRARMHAEKLGQTLCCQKEEREPKLQCRPYCKGNCSKKTKQCSCSDPNYKCE